MLLPWFWRADLICPGLTPDTGALTRVLAEAMPPPTPGGARLRCWAPPTKALPVASTPRFDILRHALVRCDCYAGAHTLKLVSAPGVMFAT
jgi:hypothetical protein